MANHKSAEKRIRQTERRTAVNKARLSRIRTFVKKVEAALDAGDKTTAQAAFLAAQPELQRGVTKGVLRVHLGLIVPEQRERCIMRVDDQVLTWAEGKCLVFDDTYEHEVRNDTDEERVVLLFDFDRPMRPLGRAVHKALVWGVKRSAYYKDAKRNMDAWEKSVQRADTMFDEPTDDRRDAA